MFDIAVIGLGMIGSAALRYLSAPDNGLRVVGIGPAEPQEWATHGGAFASHYDQARITRVTDPDTVWAVLAQRAIESYAGIEQDSGIRFHHPVGHLRTSPRPDMPNTPFAKADAIGKQLHAPVERLDRDEIMERFPYLNVPATMEGLYERGGAGFINPRALVAAQVTIATNQGATVVRDEVRSLVRETNGFVLTTSSGQTIRAARVLVSAHGYTNGLLQPLLGRALDLVNMAHSTVYAEIAPAEAERLSGMPSLIWPLEGHPVLPSVYTTPPTVYPDGRIYLKIGGPLHEHPTLDTPEAISAWFQSDGNPVEIEALQGALLDLVPDLEVRGWSSKPCMNTYTPHDHPYIGQLDDDLFVCTGGCGSGAKSSDEIGRIGALLAQHSAWRYDLTAEEFRVVYKG